MPYLRQGEAAAWCNHLPLIGNQLGKSILWIADVARLMEALSLEIRELSSKPHVGGGRHLDDVCAARLSLPRWSSRKRPSWSSILGPAVFGTSWAATGSRPATGIGLSSGAAGVGVDDDTTGKVGAAFLL